MNERGSHITTDNIANDKRTGMRTLFGESFENMA